MATSPEVGLISAVVRTGNAEPLHEHNIHPGMFHDFGREAKYLFWHLRKYMAPPDGPRLRHKFPEFRIVKTDDVESWCDALVDHHAMTMLYESMDKAATLLEEGGNPIDAAHALGTSVNKLLVDMESSKISSTSDYSGILDEVRRRTERAELGESIAWPFGFSTLDTVTAGKHPGRLIIVGARLGVGKTWMMQRWAAETAMLGGTALFVSLEMSEFEITVRQHSIMSHHLGGSFNPFDLMQGDVDLSAYEAFLKEMGKKVDGTILVSDGSQGSVSEATIAGLIQTHDPDEVYIDYLTLMQMDGKSEDHRAIAKLTRGLKQIGHVYKKPIIVAAQLNRDAEYGKANAGAENLARSDAIGQDADLVITLKDLSRSVLRGFVAKNRFGREGDHFYVEFKPGTGVIEEVAGDAIDDLMNADLESEDE